MTTPTDPVAAVQELFPTTGPHTPEQVIAAAESIAELWRYLGHAFQPQSGRIEPLENLSDAYSFVGNLALADQRATEILLRLAHWSTYIGDRSVNTEHYGITDPDGSIDQIQSLMHRVKGCFSDSSASHVLSGRYLDR
ncbi:hypothetical protein, partial [Micromonospora sp. NPDC048169]|uniref:hypothetical protein n=1 Tax=Micromonospora sp. NPDC048169 TaxID=3154711 RepID=UPI0033ECAB2D